MAAAIVLLAGGGGTALGFALRGAQTTTTQSPSATGGTSLTPSGNSGSTTTPSSGSSGANLSGIAATIDPTIVDVNDVLEGNQGTAAGTGIILTSSGEVLTNNHVIEGASSVTVQVDGQGTNYTAKVVGYDPADDIAVLQIQNASGLTTTPLGDSSSAKVGDSIVAIGNALGAGGTPAAVSGTVTGLDQSITATDGQSSEALSGMIQIAANIQRGDSGGPLVNAAGKVIGIDTAGSENGNGFGTQSTGTTGFAIPIDTALSIANQIEAGDAGGNIHVGSSGPFIGVSVEDVGASLSAPVTSGALIAGVQAGSPAATTGLVTGDVITTFNGSTVTSTGDLATALKPLRPGDTVQIGWVDSSGQSHTASLKLASGAPL
jgi:S1-C subfamily serine protease